MLMKKRRQATFKRDQYTVVLENIHSQNKVFGEALSAVYDKVGEIHEKVTDHTQKLVRVNGQLGVMDGRLSVVETDLEVIKNELALIRHNQVTRDEFKLLETRVSRLEKAGRH